MRVGPAMPARTVAPGDRQITSLAGLYFMYSLQDGDSDGRTKKP